MRFKVKAACGIFLVSLFVVALSDAVIPGTVASSSLTDRNVRLWSSTALEEPTLIAMSADGEYIVTAEGKGYSTVQQEGGVVCLLGRNKNLLWNFSVGGFLNSPEVDWVSISDDGGYTAFGGLYTGESSGDTGFVFLFSKSGQLWNKTDFSPNLGAQSYATWNMGAVSGDGSRIVVCCDSTRISDYTYSQLDVFDTGKSSGNTGQFLWSFVSTNYHYDQMGGVSISSDGQYVVVGCYQEIFFVKAPAVGVHEGVLVWNASSSEKNFFPVCISGDGKYVLTMNPDVYNNTLGDYEHHVLFYDQSGTLLWNVTTRYGTAGAGAFDCDISADGKSAVQVSDTMVYFFDQTGLKWTYDTTHSNIDHVRISADGYFTVASSTSGSYGSSPNVFHFNRFGKLVWEAGQTYQGLVDISANGEYFCSTEWASYQGQSSINLYFSKKYFNYRFVTPDSTPINALNVRWYFSNGTLCESALTNASGWMTSMFFDPHFVDYSTSVYYWQTKVGECTLVKAYQYETASDHVASLFDWNVDIHDVNGSSVAARVETYLWNGTLYDSRTASSLRFEDLPNQTYTLKAYYPPEILSGQQTIALAQEEQNSTFVIDTQAPAINNVNTTPLYPFPTNTVKISANVTDDLSGVQNSTLLYRLNSTLEWTNASMTYNATSKLYEADIPAQPLGTNVTYMITSYDNTGKQSISELASYLSSYVFDLNGDMKVDMRDIAIVARLYGARPDSPNWNPLADINRDGKIDMKDVGAFAKHYGDHY